MEEELEEASGRSGDGDSLFPSLFKRKGGAAPGSHAEISELRKKLALAEKTLEELGPQIDSAKQHMNFRIEEYRNRLGDYLNQPQNARRLFDAQAPAGDGESTRQTRSQLLEEWFHRLEERDLLFHVLAGYELRRIYADYCPPVHLQAAEKGAGESRRSQARRGHSGAISGAQDFHEAAGRRFPRDSPPHRAKSNCPRSCNSPKI